MFGVLDPSKRSLTFPSRYMAYLEKHRIYELFYELTSELIIKKPKDHILFLKENLKRIAEKRDTSRIILLTFPGIDSRKLAKCLQSELNLHIISLKDIEEFKKLENNNDKWENSNNIVVTMKNMLTTRMIDNSGWVLIDLPRTINEVCSLQRSGIIPTHVIEILETTLGSEASDAISTHHHGHPTRTEKIEYDRNILRIRKAYADSLIQVEIGGRSIEDLGKDCAKLAKVKKYRGAPSTFRIVLFGSRGSGCRTIAKYLSQRFNITHVDFNDILEQLRLQTIPLSDVVRKFEQKWGTIPNAEIRIQIIENRLLQRDCLNKGWILTGYPITVKDFKLFDKFSTPPNRIFFVDVNEDTCRERLTSRRYNVNTGSEHNLISESKEENINRTLGIHPKDSQSAVENNIREYKKHVEDLKNYAGESALVIDGNLDKKTVRERIEAYLMKPVPIAPPRNFQSLSKMDSIQIEFDPDNELNPIIFNHIRQS